MNRTRPAVLLRIAACYFVLATLALLLVRYDDGVALLWFANAYLIGELSVVRRRDWPAMLASAGLASAAATGLFGLGWGAASPMALANLAEATLAAYLLRRLARQAPFDSLRWFGRFTLAVAVVAPLVSAGLGVLVAAMLGNPLLPTFVNLFTGHALSNLTFAPVFILLAQGELRSGLGRMRKRRAEAAGLLALSIATTALSFGQEIAPLLFLPILPIILITFRLGRGGAILAILALALVGGLLTLLGYGPIQLSSAQAKAHFFQFYLATAVLTVWPVAADLRNRSRLHQELRLSEARYRLIADHSSDILMKIARDGTILYVSPSIRQIGGYAPDLLVGRSSAVLVAPGHRERVGVCHQIVMAEPKRTHAFEYEGLLADGTSRWFETHSRAVVDGAGRVTGTMSIIRDISARKATEQTLSRAASTDVLTGLPNRRAFREAIDSSRRGGDCLALLDIDHFKSVNDRFGHDAGDTVLRRFAAIARSAVRDGDLVARLGGEEFAILFRDTPIEQAMAVCERLRADVAAATTVVDGASIRITVSGGVAPIGRGGLIEALRVADAALYRAKDSGRDQLARAA